MRWPAQSSDLHIIENVWYRLKNQLQHEAECIPLLQCGWLRLFFLCRCSWTDLQINALLVPTELTIPVSVPKLANQDICISELNLRYAQWKWTGKQIEIWAQYSL